jgi:hypothetical protein
MMLNYGCHTTPMPPSVGDVFFFPADMVFHPVFLNLELSVYWHNISGMEIELGCMPVCFFLGELYNDNVRTTSTTTAQVMMSALFWSGLLASQWYGC